MSKEYMSIGHLNRRLLVRRYTKNIPRPTIEQKQKVIAGAKGLYHGLSHISGNVLHNWQGEYELVDYTKKNQQVPSMPTKRRFRR